MKKDLSSDGELHGEEKVSLSEKSTLQLARKVISVYPRYTLKISLWHFEPCKMLHLYQAVNGNKETLKV